eukprot:549373-Rhodomonas_salina.2
MHRSEFHKQKQNNIREAHMNGGIAAQIEVEHQKWWKTTTNGGRAAQMKESNHKWKQSSVSGGAPASVWRPQARAPCPPALHSSVPHILWHHTLAQYRTSHSTIC